MRRFQAVYADPAWEYDDKCQAGERGIEYVHECMSDEEVLDLGSPLSRLVARDAVLFLWAVWPKLPLALDVMAAWGFTYKTVGFLWVKTAKKPSGNCVPRLHWGMGHWTRANTEPCLLGVRGKPQRRSASIHSVVHHPRGRDKSDKPDEVRDRIRALTPSPRLELFARGPTPTGWWGWGNEAEGPRLVTL